MAKDKIEQEMKVKSLNLVAGFFRIWDHDYNGRYGKRVNLKRLCIYQGSELNAPKGFVKCDNDEFACAEMFQGAKYYGWDEPSKSEFTKERYENELKRRIKQKKVDSKNHVKSLRLQELDVQRKILMNKAQEYLTESYNNDNIFYHGSTDKNLAGKNGIHVGTKLAATQALQARIGVPAEGEWDGTREYGKTLLAGKNTLKIKYNELGYFCDTGFNCGRDVPEEDYYPTQRKERAKYSDGTPISFNSKPIVFPVKIVGRMTNSPYKPHSDSMANGLIKRQLNKGVAVSGYYYENIGEDSGSISAVVPNATFLTNFVANFLIRTFQD